MFGFLKPKRLLSLISGLVLLAFPGNGLAGPLEPASGKIDHYCDVARVAISGLADNAERPPYPNAFTLAIELARVRGNDGDKALVRKLLIDSPPPEWFDKSKDDGYAWQLHQVSAYAAIGQPEAARKVYDQTAPHIRDGYTQAYLYLATGQVAGPIPGGLRASTMVSIAKYFGNRALCDQFMAEMLKAANDGQRERAWTDLIDARLRVEEIDIAVSECKHITAPWARRSRLTSAAYAYARAGEMKKSHATLVDALGAIPAYEDTDSNIRACELLDLARAALRLGDMQVAREATELAGKEPQGKLDDVQDLLICRRAATHLPVDLAAQQATIRAMKSALDAKKDPSTLPATLPADGRKVARSLILLAEAYVWQGQYDEARKLVAEARSNCAEKEWPLEVLDELEAVPLAAAQTGEIRQAVSLAEDLLPQSDYRDQPMCGITREAARLGKVADAIDCLTHFTDTWAGRLNRTRAASAIALMLVRAQAWDRLDALVGSQKDQYTRAVVCLCVARQLQGTEGLGVVDEFR